MQMASSGKRSGDPMVRTPLYEGTGLTGLTRGCDIEEITSAMVAMIPLLTEVTNPRKCFSFVILPVNF